MKKVRAKFICTSVEETEDGEFKVLFHPVVTGSLENEEFFAATPAGYLGLQLVRKEIAGSFVKDEEYYVDITRARGLDDLLEGINDDNLHGESVWEGSNDLATRVADDHAVLGLEPPPAPK